MALSFWSPPEADGARRVGPTYPTVALRINPQQVASMKSGWAIVVAQFRPAQLRLAQ
jgi:hypothetical protein